MKKILMLSVLALGASLGFAQENYSGAWGGHKNVILNTSNVTGGAGVAGNVLNFPVLVRLGTADSNVFKTSLTTGADLRFTKANNTTRLAHQVESWNVAGRSAAIWVLVDTVYGGRDVQHIRLHWSNGAAADSSNGAQVFRTNSGFAAVYHMNGAGASSNESDATANGLTAMQVSDPAATTGQIAGARETNGSSSYFNVANSAAPLNFPLYGNFTVSAWVNATLASHGTILSKHDLSYALKLNNGGAEWEYFEYEANTGWMAVVGSAAGNTWQHVVGVQNGTQASLYIDGLLVSDVVNTTCGSCASDRNEGTDLAIGAEPTTGAPRRYLASILDEVRLAGVSRNADWVKLEYENQKTGATMVKVLDTIPPSSIAGKLPTASNGFSVKASGNGLVFRMDAKDASAARITLVDMWGRTVWSRTGALPGAGTIAWDGRTTGGQIASQGVYAVRVNLLNAQGKTVRLIERKVPLTR
jgi:hypothetical protein